MGVTIGPYKESLADGKTKVYASREYAFSDFAEHHSSERKRYLDKNRLHSRTEDAINPPTFDEQLPGQSRLRLFEEILESGFKNEDGEPLIRSRFQREFHSQCTCAMAQSIVGRKDWERKGAEIARARKWEGESMACLGKAPRRFGKSSSVGQLAIARAEAMIIHDPITNLDVQAIFSTGRRASSNLGDYCYRFALDRGLGPNIVKYTEETLWIRGGKDPKDPEGPLAKIFFYPSNPKIDDKYATQKVFFFHSFFIFFFIERQPVLFFFSFHFFQQVCRSIMSTRNLKSY